MMISAILYFAYIQLVNSECDLGGTWSTWMMDRNQTGYDYCGSCWQAKWIRECLSEPGCPCNGNTIFTDVMASGPCLAPREKCCPGLTVNGKICGKETVFPLDTSRYPTYCPTSETGIWGSWSEWGTCSATCGLNGTKKRTRPCLSEGYGCPCCESDVGACQTMPCPEKSCTVGRNCSDEYVLVTSFDGKEKYCSPFEGKIATGNWTEWTPALNAVCNDTCDQISVIQMIRYCLPSGSYCSGPFSSQQPCPPNRCPAINYDTYYKCSPDRVPRYSLNPIVVDGTTGDGSINETFVTCKVENGRAAVLNFIYQDGYGTQFYSITEFLTKTRIIKFKCDVNPTDKLWGAFDFTCFTVPYTNDDNTVINTKNALDNHITNTYIPGIYPSNYVLYQQPSV